MKYAIVTVCIGDLYKRMGTISHPLMKQYADRIGADFIVLDEKKLAQTTPHWEKFKILDILADYERVLYLDSDIIIRDDAPNIFDEVPKDCLGMFDEAPFTDGRSYPMNKGIEDYGYKEDLKWDGKYYNSGVMVVSRVHRFLFRKPEKEIFNFYEQTYLNLIIAKEKIKIHNIDYKFNRMHCMDKYTGEERYGSYFIHYAGMPDLNMIPQLMEKDVERWKQDSPNYKYKRRIWIDVQGGLGDQVDAEPTIRFLLKNIYKNEDVRISTHWTEIFRHLEKQAKVALHTEKLWDDMNTFPYRKCTLPGPDTIQWTVVSNLLAHTVDFCSMSVLGRILPDNDKTIQLKVEQEDIEAMKKVTGIKDFSNIVIVHAGRHWESKTFPEVWWQKIVDGILDVGFTPCLVGKDDETRGAVELNLRDGVIDTRNLLTTLEFFAIISQGKVLVSNDSAPVHIAGAFDNHIILIPTCKHPDHILPYRYGSKSYKSAALYKRLALDDMQQAPSTVYGAAADKLVGGDWKDYLPEPELVIEEVTKRMKKE